MKHHLLKTYLFIYEIALNVMLTIDKNIYWK